MSNYCGICREEPCMCSLIEDEEEKMPESNRLGQAIVDGLIDNVKNSNPEQAKGLILSSHVFMMELHSRALACHSECLGMNAENTWAVCNDNAPPYVDKHYSAVMEKWGMMDEEGKPII